jgi:hypothetical protein
VQRASDDQFRAASDPGDPEHRGQEIQIAMLDVALQFNWPAVSGAVNGYPVLLSEPERHDNQRILQNVYEM